MHAGEFAGDVSVDWLRAAVADRGLPAEALIASGQLVLGDARTALGNTGSFDGDAVAEGYRLAAEQAVTVRSPCPAKSTWSARRRGGECSRPSPASSDGELVLDLGELDFIDLSGMRAVVATAEELGAGGGWLLLRSPRPLLQRCMAVLDPPENLQWSS